MRVRPNYTEQFKADAVQLLERSDRSIKQVADDLGVSDNSLRTWYNRAMAKRSKKPRVVPARPRPIEERKLSPEQKLERLEREVEQLHKENASLKEDREILKKAAAFFAKESE